MSRVARASARRSALGQALALAVATLLPACREGGGPTRVLAQEEHLRRQIKDLRFLVERAEKGALVPAEGAVVVVSEELAWRLLRLTLPREILLRGRYRARLEKAEVRFRDRHGAVRLDGSVSFMEDADIHDAGLSAELTVFARLETVEVDAAQGVLVGQIVPYGFELHRLRLLEDNRAARRLAEGVAEEMSE